MFSHEIKEAVSAWVGNMCQLFVFLVCCHIIIRRYSAVSQLHSHALKHGRLLSTPNAKISWRHFAELTMSNNQLECESQAVKLKEFLIAS